MSGSRIVLIALHGPTSDVLLLGGNGCKPNHWCAQLPSYSLRHRKSDQKRRVCRASDEDALTSMFPSVLNLYVCTQDTRERAGCSEP